MSRGWHSSRERLDLMHGQVSELAERLDFAKRLLAQKRERTLRAASSQPGARGVEWGFLTVCPR